MWIPMPPKTPELQRKSRTDILVCLRDFSLSKQFTLSNASLQPAQNQNPRSHKRLHPDQPRRMRQVLRKKKNQAARNAQIPQCHMLKHPARSPSPRQFPPQQSAQSQRLESDSRDALATRNRAIAPVDCVLALLVFV